MHFPAKYTSASTTNKSEDHRGLTANGPLILVINFMLYIQV